MTSSTYIFLTVVIALAILLACVVISVRSYLLTKKLYGSFAKLGYVVREDAKKYFDEAATKIVDTGAQFHGEYKQIVEEGTKSALADSGAAMQHALDSAHKEAASIVLKAQTDARNIVEAAKQDAYKEYGQSLEHAVDAIRWSMEQYVGKGLTSDEHEQIIKKLLEMYVDERR